jgi:hypothetical protein
MAWRLVVNVPSAAYEGLQKIGLFSVLRVNDHGDGGEIRSAAKHCRLAKL